MNMDHCLQKITVHGYIIADPVQPAAERIKIMLVAVFPEVAQGKIDAI